MEPIVIADSDGDDDEFRSPPAGHLEPPMEGHVELAGASDSTDPSFFKNVFNEHFQAAIDPLQASELNRYGEQDELSDEFFVGGHHSDPRGEKPMAAEPDPYEIPSSPENSPRTMVFQSRNRSSVGMSTSLQAARAGNDESESRRGKKRKLNHHSAPEEIPSQDPLAQSMPFDEPEPQRTEPDQSSMFPPTLPPPGRFVVAPQSLTNVQKMEYHSVEPQSSLLSEDQGPALPRQVGAFQWSGSSATNVNTPRSQFMPSISQNLDFSDPGPGRILTYNTQDHIDSQERDTPPDDSAALDQPPPTHVPIRSDAPAPTGPSDPLPEIIDPPPITKKPIAPHSQDELAYEPVTASIAKYSPREEDGFADEPATTNITRHIPQEEDNLADEPVTTSITRHAQQEEDESDFGDSHVQPKKKKRGRPKKEAAQKAKAKETDAEAVGSTGEVTSASGAKKKRGRPKKSELQAAEPKGAPIDKDLDVGARKTKDTSKHIEDSSVPKQSHEGAETKACKSEDTKADMALETYQAENKVQDSLCNKQAEKGSDADAEKPANEKEEPKSIKDEKPLEQPSKGKQATASPAKSLLGSGTPIKPNYRVGLSKRSRVAPLLKIVRKDSNGR